MFAASVEKMKVFLLPWAPRLVSVTAVPPEAATEAAPSEIELPEMAIRIYLVMFR
jgi:hypothetical protein